MPLLFNPFSTQPVEAVKRATFEGLVVVMLAGLVVERRKRMDFASHQAGDLPAIAWARLHLWTSRPYLVPALAYLGACGLATLLSSDPGGSLREAATGQGMLLIASLVAFFLVIAEIVRSLEQAEWLASGVLIGSIPVALYGCIQYYGLDPLTWQTSSFFAVHSTTGYSLYLGAYLAMIIPFSLARLFAGPGGGALKRNFPYLIILALQAVCLVFTFSRAALLALVTGGGVFSAFALPSSQRRKLAGVSLALLAVGGLFFLALSYGWKFASPGQQVAGPRPDVLTIRQLSNADRLEVWQRTLPMIAGSPLTGYGPGSYPAVYARYYPTPAGSAPEFPTHWDPHNLVLGQLATAGLLGLLAFGWLVFTFYRNAIHLARHSEQRAARLLLAALLASVTAYLVQTQFNPSGLVAMVIFWLVMGIGCGLK